MNISGVFVILFAVAVVVVSGLPALQDLQQSLRITLKEEPEPELMYEDELEIEEGKARIVRATCELPSIPSNIPIIPSNISSNIPIISTSLESVKHATCSAHCLTSGKSFKGGRCIDGICLCEST